MKEIRIFVASSKELVAERNYLAYLTLANEDEFEKRGLRVRLSKWEYVDPTMAEGRTEDRYLEEMFNSDGAVVLFKTVIGKYTREEMDNALEREKGGYARLKAHRILFKDGDGTPTADLTNWRAELKPEEYGTFTDFEGLKTEFLSLIDRLPDVLWKMTRERLEKMPLGRECVKLVQMASFFSPDGFAQHILKHLWKTVVAPGLDDKKFARAVEIIRHHNLFQSTDPVRIHRLDRAAILQTAKAEAGLEDAVGASLAEYGLLGIDDWLFLCENDGIRKYLPKELISYCWARILIAHPELSAGCPWEKLSGEDWACLLSEQPQFAERCLWEKLTVKDWVGGCYDYVYHEGLLFSQPQFADLCPWEKLTGTNWVGEYYSEYGEQREYIDGVLARLPWSAKYCHLENLAPEYLEELLLRYPEFVEKCDLSKVQLSNKSLRVILIRHPDFVEKFNVAALSGYDWGVLLGLHPQLVDSCPWGKLSGSDWAELLSRQPQYADRCSWEKLYGSDWVNCLLDSQPQFIVHARWEMFSSKDWSILLHKYPKFADRCPWIRPLEKQWPKAPVNYDWNLPLDVVHYPELIIFEDVASQLKGGRGHDPVVCSQALTSVFSDDGVYLGDVVPWAFVLSYRPELVLHCKFFDEFDGFSCCVLLMRQPQFADRWSMEELADFHSDFWWNAMEEMYFQDIERCGRYDGEDVRESYFSDDDTIENSIFGQGWKLLLSAQPQFAKWRNASMSMDV